MESVTSTDGTRIAYERHGSGPPVVLVHGGSAPRYWKPVVPRLADDYTVIVPHRRGVGASDDSDDYSLERGVEDVRAVVDAVDGDPVLFGHSFGGLLALEAARDAAIDSLAVYEPAVLVGEYREQASLASQMESVLQEGDERQAMKYYVREVMHGGEIDDLDEWLDAWPPWPDIVSLAENVVRINYAIEQYHLPASLELDSPALLLEGAHGPPHLKDGLDAVEAALVRSQRTAFDGIGHGGPAEAPDRVTTAVRGFIEGDSVDASPP